MSSSRPEDLRSSPAGGRDLLVASAGGHLTQLTLIADRLVGDRPRTFVTYDHPQSKSLLAGEDVVFGMGPSSRSLRALVVNWSLARRLLATGRFDRVVSTGSAIAVPFLVEAARRHIDAHYVESATRSHGPSLSGRMLERSSRRIELHTQHARWADDRWQLVPSVFDGFEVVSGPPVTRPLRVVVSLGTHRFAFDRLLLGLRGALRPGDQVLLQHGATEPISLPGQVEAVASVPADRLEAEIAGCDVVVAHAGTGITLTTLASGHRPVLVPRSGAHGEHVDDHQHDIADELGRAGLAITVAPERLDRAVLEQAAGDRVDRRGTRAPVEL